MSDEVAGFWSYVHADNAADGGRIRSLAVKLRDAYRLQTADELVVFVDNESIEWGAEWAARIADAIAGTTFFLPIITPSYFKSQACRDELLKFTREAQRLGLEQLLMPVYWVTVRELENNPQSSPDEAIRLVARYQWQDLRAVRLEDEDSAAFRKAVSRLASELADRAEKVTETVHDAPESVVVGSVARGKRDDQDDDSDDGAEPGTPEGKRDDEDDDSDDGSEPGTLEKLVATEEGFPELTEIMDEIGGLIQRVGELVEKAEKRMRSAQARNQGMRAQLVVTEQLARQLEEPADRIQHLGHRYVEVLGSLDAGIQVALDAAESVDDFTAEEKEERAEFLEVVKTLAQIADQALDELNGLVETTRDTAKLSRSLRRPLGRMRTGLVGILDGRTIIEEWGRRAAEIEATDVDSEGEVEGGGGNDPIDGDLDEGKSASVR